MVDLSMTLVYSSADGLNYYINKNLNIPHCRNNYKIKYQNHGKMNIEASSTHIYDNFNKQW
jgi:hypothetical protein